MAHSRSIAKVKDCILYIEGCGWKFSHYNSPWYIFKGTAGRKTMSGNDTIPFTLTELRHAYNYGW
jgi:hypothetical protein